MDFSTQVTTFAILFGAGALLAFLFDTYRVMRRIFKPNWLITAVADLSYWLLATAVVFAALLLGNWGELRFYVFVSLLTGIATYYRLLSRFILRSLMVIMRWINTGMRFLRITFITLFLKPLRFLLRLLMLPFVFCQRKVKKWYRIWRPPPLPPDDTPPAQ
ncbi:MAG TPA: spore cortex biosynthesis protein YabQ [Methylomusa anaerophila]|uniref:Spore protein YabQ n=1 Tax=Methylomusa anaerophila TaxID=1930071 RepID=A0A348AJK2_9FIRM|nr:spore cortex biosynthesis protein YabQ [Methylomusa anaerophila]BBB91250.1 spore protein YabQ [Methylomusa anaerophila]HML89756.1 spore cortex biosynthesis protein YabQ [Methylomusa anaerophila]